MRRPDISAYALTGLLAAAGVTHLANPEPYDRIIPGVLPGTARQWTYGSGALELAAAAAIALPRIRRAGSGAAAGLFVAVFPANVKMAWDWRERSVAARTVAYARLPLQAPLVAWALSVRRHARHRARAR
jgi:uncharacterized membrane protein